MQKTMVFVAALAVGSVVGFACGTPTPAKCSVASCAGCCASDGSCQTGNTSAACGTQGNSCSACSSAQTCTVGACMTTTGTGGGSAAGGSAAGGAAAGGSASAGGSAGGAAAGGRAGGAGGGSAGGNGMLMFDAGMPPDVTISFATTCAASQPCGGALPGLWHYGSVCVEDTIFSRVQQLCGGANQTQILDRSGTARGAVFFNATQMARSVSGRVDFTLTTTNATCVNGFMGVGGCTSLPALAANAGITGTCALELPDGGASASTCTCRLRLNINDQATDTYTAAGNVITTAGNRTFEYCVQGTTMTYEETTPMSVTNIARDPGVSTLSKQ